MHDVCAAFNILNSKLIYRSNDYHDFKIVMLF